MCALTTCLRYEAMFAASTPDADCRRKTPNVRY
jgi:hypothetical protein